VSETAVRHVVSASLFQRDIHKLDDVATYFTIGTPDQICDDLQLRRERYGISYISIFDESMEEFAPVIAHLAGK
jgi:hypothetical protein